MTTTKATTMTKTTMYVLASDLDEATRNADLGLVYPGAEELKKAAKGYAIIGVEKRVYSVPVSIDFDADGFAEVI